jgi:hypothetical protein
MRSVFAAAGLSAVQPLVRYVMLMEFSLKRFRVRRQRFAKHCQI